jgi:hypothetical protein
MSEEGVLPVDKMLPIGTETEVGTVVGVMWIGERYYFLMDNGVVYLVPADVVEQ